MCMGRVECSGMASDKGAATACLLGRRTAHERKRWLVCGFLCVYMLASACACACTSVQQKLRIWEKHELAESEATRHCAATGFVLAYGWLFYIYSQGDQALRNCVLKGIKCLSECKRIAHAWPRVYDPHWRAHNLWYRKGTVLSCKGFMRRAHIVFASRCLPPGAPGR